MSITSTYKSNNISEQSLNDFESKYWSTNTSPSDYDLDGTSSDSEEEEYTASNLLLEQLRGWALAHKTPHSSVNDLLRILIANGHTNLPNDARTLLNTPKTVNIEQLSDGQFWYNGIKTSLSLTLSNIKRPTTISLTFNIDGIPTNRSSNFQFWPILCIIKNMPHLQPMTIAIFHGERKPHLEEFLSRFVDELNEILLTGIVINGHNIKAKINCFICDTPARSFITGTVNFNAAHGCLKCTTVGTYDKKGRHMSFPDVNCPLRTDESFRNQTDEDHHKLRTPLLKLPINMIEDIIIADSLHLLDLGIMRKCLNGWLSGSYNFNTKFSSLQINLLCKLLDACNKRKPIEIHRSIRTITCLKHWKGVEFRTFLLYVGPVILKDILYSEAYQNFLTLSCGVTILSCHKYQKYIHVADQLLRHYIEQFKNIYGQDSISMNVHNLCHVINDVKKFGPLPDISSYPFENFLGYIKSLIRTGNHQLAQVAKRIMETSKVTNPGPTYDIAEVRRENTTEKHEHRDCQKVFHAVKIHNTFLLSNNIKDQWFMTKSNDIVSMLNATYYNMKIHIYGSPLKEKRDFFDLPIKSSHLNIYQSNGVANAPQLYPICDILCKLVSFKHKNNFVFLPLLHTLDIEVK